MRWLTVPAVGLVALLYAALAAALASGSVTPSGHVPLLVSLLGVPALLVAGTALGHRRGGRPGARLYLTALCVALLAVLVAGLVTFPPSMR